MVLSRVGEDEGVIDGEVTLLELGLVLLLLLLLYFGDDGW